MIDLDSQGHADIDLHPAGNTMSPVPDRTLPAPSRRLIGTIGGVFALLGLAGPVGFAAPETERLGRPPGETTLLFRETFEDGELGRRGWYDGDRFSIVGNAVAGQGCIEYRWQERETRPSSSAGARRLFEPTDEVWIRCWLRLSKGWAWSGQSYHPHLLHFLTTENSQWHGPAASRLTLYVEPVNGRLRLAATDIQNATAPHGLTQGPLRGGYNGALYDSAERLFVDDRWHCIEAQFKLNTLDIPGDRPNKDGQVRGWFDGRLVVEQTNVVLRTTDFPAMKFNQFLMTPYFGPGLLPQAQTLWIDELEVGKTRTIPAGPTSPRPVEQTQPK